jgi:hypothetical protein
LHAGKPNIMFFFSIYHDRIDKFDY